MAAPFGFLTAGEIRFGRGRAVEAAEAVRAFGERPFVVHGATAARAQWLIEALDGPGGWSCPTEPTLAMLSDAVSAARAMKADVVVSLGGGAAIDLGKAVAALVPSECDALDHLEVVGAGLPLRHRPIPFVALPTTAGTGAEVTKNAVIGVPAHARKVSLRDDRMLADLAIVDPALTDDAPRAVTLASGLDAITQLVEPYLCTRANPLTDALCREAIPSGLAALIRLMQAEDPAARDAMAFASLCGGLALANSGLGAVHGLAGPIGGVSSAPHGAVCGALLPHVFRANRHVAGGSRFDDVAGWIGTALNVRPSTAIDALEDWAHDAGLPRLSAMGVTRGLHAGIAEAAVSASSMRANPAVLDQAALIDILERAG